jgi:hypothetical protein
VKSPQLVYLFLQGLALVWALAMAGLAVYKGRKFFDRSVQLVLDESGIHDYRARRDRAGSQELAWSKVDEVKGHFIYTNGIATSARLQVALKEGATIGVDILGLDHPPKVIIDAAGVLLRTAHGGMNARG